MILILQHASSEQEISVDLGEHFILYVHFNPKSVKFYFTLSGESLEPFSIPEPYIQPYRVRAEGDLTINYLGFTDPDVNPAVPVGTIITFACPEGQVFSHDWYARPSVKITCQSNGEFEPPDFWPVCFESKHESNPDSRN